MARKSGNWQIAVRGIDGFLLTHQFYPKKKMALKVFRELGEEYVKTNSIEELGKLENGIYIKFDTIQIILFQGDLGGVK